MRICVFVCVCAIVRDACVRGIGIGGDGVCVCVCVCVCVFGRWGGGGEGQRRSALKPNQLTATEKENMELLAPRTTSQANCR